MRSLLIRYGWLRSLRKNGCFDTEGNPIPWFTYPAIDFISGLDISDKRVFEWGSGNSTLFWGKFAREIVSIETDPKWYEYLKPKISSNCSLLYVDRDRSSYVGAIDGYDRFDVIVIDGEVEHRKACCLSALEHIADGGIIVLDNSDQCPESTALLQSADLIQVDFTGFAPLNVYAHTTSIFFTRSYSFTPRDDGQPHKSVAQPYDSWQNQ